MRELLTSPATLRVLLYLIAPVLAMVPGVSINEDAGTILININTALTGLAAGMAAGGGIFAIWGKK
jgi:hypothetical protein